MQAPLVDPLSILDVEDLREIVERRRSELVEAEEGQRWVDAIAAEVIGDIDPHRQAVESALVALGPNPSPKAVAALDSLANDLLTARRNAQRSVDAAAAHRRVTVDQARARLTFYEELLAVAPETGEVPGARQAIVDFENGLAGR